MNRATLPVPTATTTNVIPPDDAAPAGHPPDLPSRRDCLIGGLGLLLMAVLAGFGNFVAIEGLVTRGDPTATGTAITGSHTLFRLGILSLVAVVILDVVVAWALYKVFAPVNRTWSTFAAGVRLVYSAIFAIAIAQLGSALQLLDPARITTGSASELHTQALAHIDAFNSVWDAGLILFGAHLIAIAYLTHRSGFLPRFLGVLLLVAGAGYVVDGIIAMLTADPPMELSTITFIGEFLLALWLTFGSARISAAQATRHPARTPDPPQ